MTDQAIEQIDSNENEAEVIEASLNELVQNLTDTIKPLNEAIAHRDLIIGSQREEIDNLKVLLTGVLLKHGEPVTLTKDGDAANIIAHLLNIEPSGQDSVTLSVFRVDPTANAATNESTG